MSEPAFDRTPAAAPLDRETLLARFDGIRQFTQGAGGPRTSPCCSSTPLHASSTSARPRSGSTRPETTLQPLLRVHGPRGASARVSYRLVGDGLWQLPGRADLFDAGGNIREGVARERDTPAGFTPEVLATFEREPELIDVAALRLLDRHFAPGLHEEILGAVGLELGTPVATRRRDVHSAPRCSRPTLPRAASAGFSLRSVDGLIGVDAAHIRWHAYGGPDEVPNGLALCALHHRLFDHGAITVREDLRVRWLGPWREAQHAIS